jgi:hypothetical protein
MEEPFLIIVEGKPVWVYPEGIEEDEIEQDDIF